MLLDLYCIGFVIAFMMTMHCLQEGNRVGWLDILGSVFVAVFSWVGVLALLLGRHLRNNSASYNEIENENNS